MRNLLAIRNATRLQTQNLTKQTKESIKPADCDDITKCIDFGDQFSGHGLVTQISLKKDFCFCIDSRKYVSFLFAPGLTVEGVDSDYNKIGPVQNAWGVSTGYYKITATQDVSKPYFWANEISLGPPDGLAIPGDWRHVAVFKDWDGKMKSEVDVKDKDKFDIDVTAEYLYTFAPKVTVSWETEDTLAADAYPPPKSEVDYKKGTVSAETVKAFVIPGGIGDNIENKKYEGEVSVEIKIDEQPSFYPNKIFQMKPNMIFDDNVEEYEFLDSGGLSGGAIAGIVIACVVVVGVVVFCIVWFVVLKKGCCCGNGGKNSDAEA